MWLLAFHLKAFAGYFDIGFEQVPNLVHMSTSPRDEPTHWKQTVFYLAQPFQVNTGKLNTCIIIIIIIM